MATALIAGNVSCSQPAGGNTYVPDGGNGDQTGDDKEQGGNGGQTGGNEQGGTIGGGTGTGGNENPDPEEENKYPDYYIDKEFGGQRFVAEGTYWAPSASNEFTTCYENAKKYMTDKVAEIKDDLAKQPNNQYSNTINYVLYNYNVKNNINDDIFANYKALAPFFADLERPYIEDAKNYNKLLASYHKLAHNAYNLSLGAHKDSRVYEYFRANGEMDILYHSDDRAAAYAEELQLAGYGTTDISVTEAGNNMNTYLNSMSSRTNISSNVLKEIVELALYNESLYGLNDMTKIYGIIGQNLTPYYRTKNYFDDEIISELENNMYNLQSVDDGRTM